MKRDLDFYETFTKEELVDEIDDLSREVERLRRQLQARSKNIIVVEGKDYEVTIVPAPVLDRRDGELATKDCGWRSSVTKEGE